MIYLRQSTASQEVPLGYFLDSTDGNTEETGLTIANTDIKVWKAGATTLASKNSGGATHISNGIYYTVLDATDTNTAGSLVIFVHVSGALTVRLECVVLTATIYDSLIAGTDLFDVSLVQVAGATTNVAALATNVDAILTDTADMQPKLGTPAASVSADIAAVKAQTAAIETDTGTDIQATLSTIAGYIDTEVSAIKAKTDNLPASPAAVSDIPTVGAIADQVWDEAISGHAIGGSTGAALSSAGSAGDPWSTALPGAYGAGTAGQIVGDYLDTAVSGISAGSGLDAAGVRAAVGLASANLDTQLGTIDSNVDDILTDTGTTLPGTLSTIAGYIDTEVAAIKAVTDALPDSGALSSLATASALSTVSSNVSAVKAKTDNLPSDPADQSAVEAAILASWSTSITESYAANGAEFTPAQGLYAVHQMLMQFAIAGTDYTVKKLDGSTTAFVVTLDDATTPTSLSRD